MANGHRRYDASVAIDFNGAAEFLAHYLSTISKGSFFVPGPDSQPLGSVLHIVVTLPITREQVELAGVVAAEVNQGEEQGMLVHLLPIADAEQTTLDSCVRLIEGKARGRVLVIHEDRDFRTRAREALDDNGYSTLVVHSAQRGIEVLDSGGIDLVLASLTMPDLNGLVVAKHMAALPIPPSIGILLVAPSSSLEADERKRAKSLGVIGVLKHSAKPKTIIKAVEGSFARPRKDPSPIRAAPPPVLSPPPNTDELHLPPTTGLDQQTGTPTDRQTAELDGPSQPAPTPPPPPAISGDAPPPPPAHEIASTVESSLETVDGDKTASGTFSGPTRQIRAAAGRADESESVITKRAPYPSPPDADNLPTNAGKTPSEPSYPDVVTERHQFAQMLEDHLKTLGVKTNRTPDGRGVEGELVFQKIKLATPFGSGTPIPQVMLVGVGRDKVKCIAPTPMDELPPIDVAELTDQDHLEGKIMGAFNRRLKEAYRMKGWLGSYEVSTYLDPERFCCFGRSEVGGHKIVFSVINDEEALIEEINGRRLNDVMPAQQRRFSLQGIRSRGDLDFRIDPFIGPAQQALLNARRP